MYLCREGGRAGEREREREKTAGTFKYGCCIATIDSCIATYQKVTYYQDYFAGGRERLGAVISYGRVIKYYIIRE